MQFHLTTDNYTWLNVVSHLNHIPVPEETHWKNVLKVHFHILPWFFGIYVHFSKIIK